MKRDDLIGFGGGLMDIALQGYVDAVKEILKQTEDMGKND